MRVGLPEENQPQNHQQQQQQIQQQQNINSSSSNSLSVPMDVEMTPASPLTSTQVTVSAVTDSGNSATSSSCTTAHSPMAIYVESTTSTLVMKKRQDSTSSLSPLTPKEVPAATSASPEDEGEGEVGEDTNKPEKRKKIRELFNALIGVERSRIDPAQREAERAHDKVPKRMVKLSDLLPSKILQRRKQQHRTSGLRTELRQPSSPLGSISS